MSYIGNVDPSVVTDSPSGSGLVAIGGGRQARRGSSSGSGAVVSGSASAGDGGVARASGDGGRHGRGSQANTTGLVDERTVGAVGDGASVL